MTETRNLPLLFHRRGRIVFTVKVFSVKFHVLGKLPEPVIPVVIARGFLIGMFDAQLV